ncbi:putative transcription factor interactor and regulator CCHC(Zn) family [Helianthus annuus]|uniref:Transcription factor interactor and regulator CCHC(Zn) family n=1 Tax=Helianthus annuus TaxID=4232 RepID=A0A9K3J965_HELAN|nr:putative transcription factor interactor and regulator CCHC(Zn) family [Helianthus annuus]KAJ0581475.1 putative transcription factor interactor and regulator CCHC(Zn) family [Helianthus annuus]KAJ0589422.1 putative transcription factor interactor and regulator CCHC(Zn) family [Helianthus annuus]KAJ0597417.1 putative transcription factor interactor and regulator ARID family [Helianthus annuus]KAJ0761742.1 putative transcription factor interactor and regulator CCHC(Zn) family [Helianthus annuu
MKFCDRCYMIDCDCEYNNNPVRSEWSWVSDDSDTNIGIRAEGSHGHGKGCSHGNACLRSKGKGVEIGSSSDVGNVGKCGRGCNRGKRVAQGKPTKRSVKSSGKDYAKKKVPKGVGKKVNRKGKAPVGRPRKAGVTCFICKQFGHIASICPSRYINLGPLPEEDDYLVDGTSGGLFSEMWVVDPSFKTHMTGNRSLFKRFKRHFGVITNEKKKNFSFVHGIGEVRIPVDGRDKTISCISYVPKMEKNVLSLEQLLFQGIETVTTGDKCMLKRMFGAQVKNFDVYEDKSNVDLEEDYLNRFYDQFDVDNGYRMEKEKLKEYIEDYYEGEFKKEREERKKANGEGTSGTKKDEVVFSKKHKVCFMIYYEGMKDNPRQSRQELRERAVVLSQDEDDVIENGLIMDSCLEPLDLLLMHEELAGYDKFYDANFDDVLIWFLPSFLGIVKSREMPPKLLDGRDVNLLLLYRIVNLKGGIKKVLEDDSWAEVALEYGYEKVDGFEMKVSYVHYIELFEWYFDYMKKKGDKNAKAKEKDGKKNAQVKEVKTEDDADLVITFVVTDDEDA